MLVGHTVGQGVGGVNELICKYLLIHFIGNKGREQTGGRGRKTGEASQWLSCVCGGNCIVRDELGSQGCPAGSKAGPHTEAVSSTEVGGPQG